MENVQERQIIKLGEGNTIKSVDLVEIINHFRQIELKCGMDGKMQKPLIHKNLMAKIRKEIEILKNAGLNGEINFKPSSYINSQNKEQPCFELNRDGMLQMLNSESTLVRYKTIEYVNKLEEENKQLKEERTERERLLLQLFSNDTEVVSSAHEQLVELEKKPLLDRTEYVN